MCAIVSWQLNFQFNNHIKDFKDDDYKDGTADFGAVLEPGCDGGSTGDEAARVVVGELSTVLPHCSGYLIDGAAAAPAGVHWSSESCRNGTSY